MVVNSFLTRQTTQAYGIAIHDAGGGEPSLLLKCCLESARLQDLRYRRHTLFFTGMDFRNDLPDEGPVLIADTAENVQFTPLRVDLQERDFRDASFLNHLGDRPQVAEIVLL